MLEKSYNLDFQWAQIVGRAWADGDFKKRLFANPAEVFQEYELELPAGCRVAVLDDTGDPPEDTDEVQYLVLPAKPSEDELSEDELISGDGPVSVQRCGCGGCGWCGRCGRCYCGWCYHSPQPDDH